MEYNHKNNKNYKQTNDASAIQSNRYQLKFECQSFLVLCYSDTDVQHAYGCMRVDIFSKN